MTVSGHYRNWEINDEQFLNAVLATRDSKGGALFWMGHTEGGFPALAIRVSGELTDVHYFPTEGTAGFRCLGGDGLPPHAMTKFIYEGCDPAAGEETPNEFIIPFEMASLIAHDFFVDQKRSDEVQWLEL